ncbi:flagellar hook-length control protein FliK [Hyphobacterium sp.]|uniref:flagellar hook-length control protein FliK n=1 Tax=Hyphobacterium sp. TaxID=2004662 RepID=UPI003BAB2139
MPLQAGVSAPGAKSVTASDGTSGMRAATTVAAPTAAGLPNPPAFANGAPLNSTSGTVPLAAAQNNKVVAPLASPGESPVHAAGKSANLTAAAPKMASADNPANPTVLAQTAETKPAPPPSIATVSQAATPAPSTVAAPTPEAGVQARRAADGTLAPLAGKPVAKTPAQSVSAPAQVGGTPKTAPAAATKPNIPASPQVAAPVTHVQPLDREATAARMQIDGRNPVSPPGETQSAAPTADADSLELGQTRAAETARTAERPGTAAGTARFTPANAGALAAQIAAKFQNGERRFEIRMDPPELGRVEVRMQVGPDNRVQAILSADRPETLQDMRQHIRELERALNEAGLELGENGLSFELSQDRDDGPDDRLAGSAFSELALAEDRAGDLIAAAQPTELYGFRLASNGGVDIRL